MPPKILLADDSITIQKMVHQIFENQAVELTLVGNGEAAIRKAMEIHPDLVLADIFMPGKNGYEVCEFIKGQDGLASVPVLLLVGAFEPFDEKEAARVGADDHLKKPFDPKMLLQAVSQFVAVEPAIRVKAPKVNRPSVETHEARDVLSEDAIASAKTQRIPSPFDQTLISPPPVHVEMGERPEVEPRLVPPSPDLEMPLEISHIIEEPGTSELKPSGPVTDAVSDRVEWMEPAGLPSAEVSPAVPIIEADFIELKAMEYHPVTEAEGTMDWREKAAEGAGKRSETFSGVPSGEEYGPKPVQEVTGEESAAVSTSPLEAAEQPSTSEATPRPEEPVVAVVSPPPETMSTQPVFSTASLPEAQALSEEALDAIARRVIEHMSDRVVQEIAWEIVPDVAEMVLRKQISSKK